MFISQHVYTGHEVAFSFNAVCPPILETVIPPIVSLTSLAPMRNGYIARLNISLVTAPGTSESVVLSLVVNGSVTALTATCAGASQITATSTGAPVLVKSTDTVYLTLLCSMSCAPCAALLQWDFLSGIALPGEFPG